jgi:hypothetical protein
MRKIKRCKRSVSDRTPVQDRSDLDRCLDAADLLQSNVDVGVSISGSGKYVTADQNLASAGEAADAGYSDPVFFAKSEGLLVLGTADSPFRYRVNIRSQKQAAVRDPACEPDLGFRYLPR